MIISCSTCCLVGLVKATWVCASFDSNLDIISCSTCCLVGPVKATWVCVKATWVCATRISKLAQTHVTLTDPTRPQVLQLMMTRLESKLAHTHMALTGPTRQQVLQMMMTRLESSWIGVRFLAVSFVSPYSHLTNYIFNTFNTFIVVCFAAIQDINSLILLFTSKQSTNAIFNIIYTYTHPFCTFNKKTPKNGYTRNQPIHFSMTPKIWI